MLRRASVHDLSSGKVNRENAYVVIAMRLYPRFVRRELCDEYLRALAPDAELFKDYKARERKLKNHNAAFALVDYERRFRLSQEGMSELRRLSEMARDREVALICQCRDYDRCHTDLLLQIAEKYFSAPVKGLIFDYPDFRERLAHKLDSEFLLRGTQPK